MALGDDNSRNQVYSSTFYSRIKFRNQSDKTVFGFSFKNGLLVININEEKDNFKYEEIASINLSPAKARLLRDKLSCFATDCERVVNEGVQVDSNHAYGVDAGFRDTVSFIAFRMTGELSEAGYPQIGCTIGKVDQDGTVHDNFEFIFNTNYHYSLEWSNLGNMDVSKNINDALELKILCDVLDEYIGSYSGAAGYMTFDVGRYEMNRMIKPIYEKLNIDTNRSSGNRGGDSGGFFANSNNGGSNRGGSISRNVDEIEDLMNNPE